MKFLTEQEPFQNVETEQTADPISIAADGISEAIEEVQTGSPLLIEIKKEVGDKEVRNLEKSGEAVEDVTGNNFPLIY